MQCCTVRPTKYGLVCKTRPPVSFVKSKFQKQNLLVVPFHFVSQQKTRSSTVVFDVALAVRPIRNNTFEINWYVVPLPNPVGSTAKTSPSWHTILWMHSISSSLRALWTKLSREAFTTVFVDRIEIHQSQPDSMTKKRLQGHASGYNWWISIRSVNNTEDWRKFCSVLSTFCFLTNQRKVQILD